MPAPLNASLPPGFQLSYNYSVRVTAQDPTDGSTVTAVKVSEVSVSGDPGGTSSPVADVPVFPAFLPA